MNTLTLGQVPTLLQLYTVLYCKQNMISNQKFPLQAEIQNNLSSCKEAHKNPVLKGIRTHDHSITLHLFYHLHYQIAFWELVICKFV